MQKLVVFLVLALAAVATAQRGGGTTTRWTSCTASGDPHFTTFDGAFHDFQGEGIFQAARNDYINVQYQAVRCNFGAPTPVTCIRRVIVRVTDPLDESKRSTIDYTSWPGTNFPVNIDGTDFNTASIRGAGTAAVTASGLASVASTGTNQITILSLRNQFEIVIGQYYLAIKLPFLPGSFGSTYGICGFFDGDGTNEFTGANGVRFTDSRAGQRTNNAQTNSWGASFAVSASGPIAPLSSKALFWNLESKDYVLMEDIPTPVIPTPAQNEELQKVPFKDLDSFTTAREKCEQLSPGDEATIENCVYDTAVLGDTTMASSNAAAATAAVIATESDDSSSGIGAGGIAGIVLGCVAFVALVGAFVLYIRLRKVSAAYSRALIIRQQSANQASTKPEDNLSEHL